MAGSEGWLSENDGHLALAFHGWEIEVSVAELEEGEDVELIKVWAEEREGGVRRT